jgi:TfoX/Sxy family transcriptional regulator of competence genes
MPTTDSQLNYILEQLSFVPEVRSKKMFGEYGLYSQNIYFGLVCDDKLFLKTSKKLVELIVEMMVSVLILAQRTRYTYQRK